MSEIYKDDRPEYKGPDPIFRKNDGLWYFSDETWSEEYGPYKTREKAQKSLDKYVYWLDHGPTRWQKFWWPIIRWFS